VNPIEHAGPAGTVLPAADMLLLGAFKKLLALMSGLDDQGVQKSCGEDA